MDQLGRLLSTSAHNEDDPLVGQVIDGRYEVRRRIGEGGMGAVYEVEHVRIGRRFALKTLHAGVARNAEVVARFHREARAAGAIGSEHIIEVSDMGQLPGGEPFLVMEYLEGHDLGQDLERNAPLPVGRAVRIAMQACEALAAAHAKGIIHRDLKPENIFLVERRNDPDFVKLVDFGISKFKEHVEGLDGQPMTRTGATLGTPYYMAPEQAEGVHDIDGRTDVYAMGVVLFQAMTGTVPFDAPTFPALVMKIVQDPPPSATDLRAAVPEDLDAVMQRAMAKGRDQRYDGIEELRAALEPFAAADVEGELEAPSAGSQRPAIGPRTPHPSPARPSTTPQTTETVVRPPLRGRARLLTALAAGVLLVGGGISALTLGQWTGAETGAGSPGTAGAPMRDAGVDAAPVADGGTNADRSNVASSSDDAGTEEGPVAEPNREPPETESSEAESTEPERAAVRRRAQPEREEREPVERPRPQRRQVTVHNHRRASVTVVLECGGITARVKVGAGATGSLRAPARDCRVQCSGLGQPTCPLRLRAGQSSLTVR